MRAFLAIVAAAMLAASLPVIVPAFAQDPIAARKANRTAIRDDFRWINQQQNAGELPAIAERAGAMLQRSGQFLALFPAGSDSGNTGALPTVWSDWATFQSREADLEAKLKEIQAAAQAGNRDGVRAAVRATGGTCQACHDRFRKPTT